MVSTLALPPPTPILSSFNFNDIASQTGYVIYYLGNIGSQTDEPGGGGSSYTSSLNTAISSNVFYSDVVEYPLQASAKYTAQNANSYTKVIDADFDILFNLPRNIKGTAIITIPALHYNIDGAQYRVYAWVKIRKWDGSTETEIANGYSAVWAQTGGTATINTDVLTAKITVPLTHYKKGEYLRITIEMYGACDAGGPRANNELYLGCDPQGRVTSNRTTRAFNSGDVTVCTAQIPFRIDT